MTELCGSSGLDSTYLCIFNETCIKKAALLVLAGFFHVFVSWQAIDDVGKSQLGQLDSFHITSLPPLR